MNYIARSPRALLMGDAYTALADDEFTLFYNPAASALGEGFELHLFNFKAGISNALDEIDRFKDFPSRDVSGIIERLAGFPVYVNMGTFPGFKLGPITFTSFFNSKSNLFIQNSVNPLININHRYDRGFAFGFGHSFGKGKPRKRSKRKKSTGSNGSLFSVGASVKYVRRQGVDGNFDLFSPVFLDAINNGINDTDDLRRVIGNAEGKAWGGDLGILYNYMSGGSTFSTGMSLTNLGMHFRKTGGNQEVPEQEMFWNWGSAWSQDFGPFGYTISFDIHPLSQALDFGRKLHFGFEARIPFISFMAGYNSGYISYGAGIDIFPVKLYAGFYSVELGGGFRSEEGERAVVYLSLLDIEFSP